MTTINVTTDRERELLLLVARAIAELLYNSAGLWEDGKRLRATQIAELADEVEAASKN